MSHFTQKIFFDTRFFREMHQAIQRGTSIEEIVNPLVCRKETFLEIVNSVPNRKRVKDLENFFKYIFSVDIKNCLEFIFITFLLVILVKLSLRRVNRQRKSRVELVPSGESDECGSTVENVNCDVGIIADSVEESDEITLEIEENERKKVALVKRKSMSAAPNLNSYRLRHLKPKLKLLPSFDILHYMFVFLFCFKYRVVKIFIQSFNHANYLTQH